MKSYQSIKDKWTTRTIEWVVFKLAYGFSLITRPISLWTLGAALAPIGGVIATVLPSARRRVLENLNHVWPEMSETRKKTLLHAIGREFMRLMLEYAHFQKLKGQEIKLDVDGIEHFKDAKAAGKGVILVTAHFGNWEAIRLATLLAGYPSGIIYRAFNNRYLDRHTIGLIAGLGQPVVQKGRSGVRKMLVTIARGGTMMILVDQRNTGAPMIPFLGKPAPTVLAAAEIALQTDAVLIPAVALRDSKARCFKVTFEEPVTGSDPLSMMTEVNRRIDRWIEDTPEQWFWFHRRWKTASAHSKSQARGRSQPQ